MTGADLLHNFRGLRGIPVSPVKAAVSHCIFLLFTRPGPQGRDAWVEAGCSGQEFISEVATS